MRTLRSRFSPTAFALALVASGALAAPPSGPAPEPATPAEFLSAPETLARAKDSVEKMQDTLRDIVALQEAAKKQKDIIRVNCLQEKVTQVKGHLAVADGAMGNLNEALAKGDDEGRKHEYQRVNILYQKVILIGTEARNCVGEDVSYIGGTQVTEWIDPTIPQKDYTAFDFPSLDTTRPPIATGF